MSDETTGFSQWKFFGLLGLAAIAAVFWRDARDRFIEFSAHSGDEVRLGSASTEALLSAQGWTLGPVDAADAAVRGYAVDDLALEPNALRLRLRAVTANGDGAGLGSSSAAPPALAVVLASQSGRVLRTLLFLPGAYSPVAGRGAQWIRLPLVPRPGEVQVTVRPVLANLWSVQ